MRYFFHFQIADVTVPDLEGVELSAIDLATAEDWENFIQAVFRNDDEIALAGGCVQVINQYGRVVAVVSINAPACN